MRGSIFSWMISSFVPDIGGFGSSTSVGLVELKKLQQIPGKLFAPRVLHVQRDRVRTILLEDFRCLPRVVLAIQSVGVGARQKFSKILQLRNCFAALPVGASNRC